MRTLVMLRALIAGVQIAIPARKAAAGDLNPQAMLGQKHVACRPEIDLRNIWLRAQVLAGDFRRRFTR